VLNARDPNLLAIDHVFVADPFGEGGDAGGVGAGGRLRDAEGLQADLAAGDLRQIAFLLLGRAMLEDGAHGVHLGVAGAAVAAGAMDLFQHRSAGGVKLFFNAVTW